MALPLPDEALSDLVAWQREQLPPAAGARLVPRENLHVTLAFLGRTPAGEVPRIVDAVQDAAGGLELPVLAPARYRETRSVGMVVLADEGDRATHLAERLSSRLSALGLYEPERRPWLPHVTVLRFRERPRLSPVSPDFGAFSPSEVALYHSVLRPSGAQYAKRESVALGG